jgi:tetratricopeptide (TPR) repeat protein
MLDPLNRDDLPQSSESSAESTTDDALSLASVQLLLDKGNSLLAADNVNEAIVCYRQALELNPNFAQTYQQLATALKQAGKYEEAVLYYRQAIVLNASNLENKDTSISPKLTQVSAPTLSPPTVSAPLSNFTFQGVQGNNYLDKSRINLRPSINIGNNFTAISWSRGNSLYQNSILYFEAAQVYLHQAMSYSEEKKWDKAIESCEKALKIAPQMAEAYKTWGNALQKLGQTSEAMGYYAKALEIKPDYVEVYANLGSLWAQKKKWSIAIEYYQKAISLDPNFAGAYRNLAKVWMQLGEEAKAKECNYIALALEPENATAQEHYNMGEQAYEQGKYQDAIAFYQNAIKLNPNFLEAYQKLADSLEKLGEWQAAATYYRQILQLKSNTTTTPALTPNNNVVANLQNPEEEEQKLLFPSGDDKIDENINRYLMALEVQPDSAELHADLGSLYAQKQQWQEAIAYYKKAIKINPKFAGVYRNLSKVLVQIGQKDSGAEVGYRALVLEPEKATAQEYYYLGNLFLESNKFKQAIDCFNRSLQLKPDFEEAKNSLRELLQE